jgi:hypothetical protein
VVAVVACVDALHDRARGQLALARAGAVHAASAASAPSARSHAAGRLISDRLQLAQAHDLGRIAGRRAAEHAVEDARRSAA